MTFSASRKTVRYQSSKLLWKWKQKVNKCGWVIIHFQFRECLWTNLPATYWAPLDGISLSVSKSSSCKKLRFCELKKGLKMLLPNLLAWSGGYKLLYNCKDKSMSMLVILLIPEYLDKKTRISSVKTFYQIAWLMWRMSKNLWSATFVHKANSQTEG